MPKKPDKIYVLNLFDGSYVVYDSLSQARDLMPTTIATLTKSIRNKVEFHINREKTAYLAWKSSEKVPKDDIIKICERLGRKPKIPDIKVELKLNEHTTILVPPEKANENYRLKCLAKYHLN